MRRRPLRDLTDLRPPAWLVVVDGGNVRRSMRYGVVGLAVVGSVVAMSVAPAHSSAQVGLRVHEVADGGVRVDGMLRDWRTVPKVAVGRGADASMQVAVGYDATGLYLAADVADERLIRTDTAGRGDDAVVVTLAVRNGRRWSATEVWLYPGAAGKPGACAVGGLSGRLRAVTDAQVVEARSEGGYELEAFVPWRRIPGSRHWQEGRMAIRLHDVDSEARPEAESEPATALVDRQHLERLPAVQTTGGSQALLAQFASQQGVTGAEPRHRQSADVCGDRRRENVVQLERYVVVFGEGYRDSSAYDFAALPVQSIGDVHGLQLRDFTGDGKAELVVEMTQRDGDGSRKLWQLFTFDCRSIRPLFAIETRKQTVAGYVESRLRVVRSQSGPPRIEVSVGPARGLDADSFREAPASDAQSILVPWGAHRSRTYQWDGTQFAVVAERDNPAQQRRQRRSSDATEPRERSAERAAPASFDPRTLVAAVRRARNIPRSIRPRYVRDVDVAEDRASERVLVLGDALLVVGRSFRGGDGYFHFQLPVSSADDILGVETVDLTGDRKAEILVRVRQHLGEVHREVLMVHRFDGDQFPRLAAVEVARSQGSNALQNEVRAGRGRLEIRPGRARGWSATHWPWADSASESPDGIDPPLLPWRDRGVTYRYRNQTLQRSR